MGTPHVHDADCGSERAERDVERCIWEACSFIREALYQGGYVLVTCISGGNTGDTTGGNTGGATRGNTVDTAGGATRGTTRGNTGGNTGGRNMTCGVKETETDVPALTWASWIVVAWLVHAFGLDWYVLLVLLCACASPFSINCPCTGGCFWLLLATL